MSELEIAGLARALFEEAGDALFLFDPDTDQLLRVNHLAEQMTGKTWLKARAAALVDEIPMAYKDIDQVMADQSDLVEVLHTLHQVLNYKGT